MMINSQFSLFFSFFFAIVFFFLLINFQLQYLPYIFCTVCDLACHRQCVVELVKFPCKIHQRNDRDEDEDETYIKFVTVSTLQLTLISYINTIELPGDLLHENIYKCKDYQYIMNLTFCSHSEHSIDSLWQVKSAYETSGPSG